MWWKIFRFHTQIPKEKQKQLRPCGKCFATLILEPRGTSICKSRRLTTINHKVTSNKSQGMCIVYSCG